MKAVYVQDLPLTIEVNGGHIVWQRRPHLRVEFEDARFAQGGEHGIGGRHQLERSTHRYRRAVVALDAGCADDQPSVRARNDVDRAARMQQPQCVVQFDVGRLQPQNLPANAAEL